MIPLLKATHILSVRCESVEPGQRISRISDRLTTGTFGEAEVSAQIASMLPGKIPFQFLAPEAVPRISDRHSFPRPSRRISEPLRALSPNIAPLPFAPVSRANALLGRVSSSKEMPVGGRKVSSKEMPVDLSKEMPIDLGRKVSSSSKEMPAGFSSPPASFIDAPIRGSIRSLGSFPRPRISLLTGIPVNLSSQRSVPGIGIPLQSYPGGPSRSYFDRREFVQPVVAKVEQSNRETVSGAIQLKFATDVVREAMFASGTLEECADALASTIQMTIAQCLSVPLRSVTVHPRVFPRGKKSGEEDEVGFEIQCYDNAMKRSMQDEMEKAGFYTKFATLYNAISVHVRNVELPLLEPGTTCPAPPREASKSIAYPPGKSMGGYSLPVSATPPLFLAPSGAIPSIGPDGRELTSTQRQAIARKMGYDPLSLAYVPLAISHHHLNGAENIYNGPQRSQYYTERTVI